VIIVVILVVEDNRALASNIIEFLEAHGFECDYADNGHLGLKLAKSQAFSTIILDIMLPGIDGMSICQQIRQSASSSNQNTPILMLTARDTLEDKLQGFDVGADDYLVKPFDLPELVARVKVLIKRTDMRSRQKELTVADLSMNIELREVKRAGQNIELNKACWKILEALLLASPKVVTRQEIEHIIWPDQLPDSDVLKSHIYKLRQLVDKPFNSPLIQTVRGIGLSIKGVKQDES
jgi:DNA-binding response OmpR family regulator